MVKKTNTVTKQPSHVQEQIHQEQAFLRGFLTLNKLKREPSQPDSNILVLLSNVDKPPEKRTLKFWELRNMSLLAVLEESCASLRNDPSSENELRQSAIVMECISTRVEDIITHTNSTSLIPPYIQEYMSKVSNSASRIISLLNGAAETAIPEFLRKSTASVITDTPVIQDDLHEALQQEVLRMIETKTPPNGERYNARVKKGSKKENAKEFLLRVYAKFTKPVNEATDSPFPLQGIYQDQIGKIDKELLVGINQYVRDHDKKTSDFLLPKASRNDLAISKLKFDLSINKKTIGMISSRIRKSSA